MLTGQKTCTAEDEKYGEVGDTFKAFGAIFRITEVKQTLLKNVSLVLWRQEGCDSAFHYTVVWKRLHPQNGWVPHKLVWVHWFRKVK